MTHVLEWIYNWIFISGALVGYAVMRIYCYYSEKRRGEERTHPSRIWIAGLISLGILGYVLLAAQHASDRAGAVARDQLRCQGDLNDVVRVRSTFTDKTNSLAKRRSDLLDELDAASADWLSQLLNPPADIAKLTINNDRRQNWGLDVTRLYFERANKIRDEIAQVRNDQTQLAKDLASHPVPILCQHRDG